MKGLYVMHLNKEQEIVASHDKGPALVLAAAGSGKSTTLVERAVRLIEKGTPTSRVLLVTFSKKAAESLQSKIYKRFSKGAYGFNVMTFHGLGNKIIRESIDHLSSYSKDFQVMKSWEQKKIILELAEQMKWDIDFKIVLSTISRLKKELVPPSDALQYLKSCEVVMAEEMANIYGRYEAQKIKGNLIDFDDMILIANQLLTSNTTVRKEWQSKYDYIMIDECQDNNLAQFRIAEILAEKHNNIMMIGDDLQSIYGFQFSRPDITIKGFYDTFKAKLYKLSINYRSSSAIVEHANKLTEYIGNPFGKEMAANNTNEASPVVWTVHETADTEASFVVEQVLAAKASDIRKKFKDFAVLYRTNKQSRALEQAFVNKSVPYVIYGGDSFFSRREVQDILAFLKVAENPYAASYELEQIINISSNHYRTATRRLGKQFIAEAKRVDRCLWTAVQGMSLKPYQRKAIEDLKFFVRGIQVRKTIGDKIKFIIDQSYTRYLRNEFGITDEDGDSRLEILEEIQNVFSQYMTFDSLNAYVQKMLSFEDRQKDPDFDGVQIMTIHKSKGLEWDTVFVIGMNDTVIPHARSGEFVDGVWKEGDISEERRICYVGITRAANNLLVSSTNDSRGGHSMFLREMGIVSPVNVHNKSLQVSA
jgi:DNA helicase-2/ATP-dependent DNA helicase PcrA